MPSGLLRALQLLLLWALWHQVELHFLDAARSRRCRKGVWDVSLESSREKGPRPAVNGSKRVYWRKKCVEQPVWLLSVCIFIIKHLPSTTGLLGLG